VPASATQGLSPRASPSRSPAIRAANLVRTIAPRPTANHLPPEQIDEVHEAPLPEVCPDSHGKVTRCLESLIGIPLISRGGSVHIVLRAVVRFEPVYEAIRQQGFFFEIRADAGYNRHNLVVNGAP
jgi:hypothetical protein